IVCLILLNVAVKSLSQKDDSAHYPRKKYSLSDILESFSISFAIHAVLPNNSRRFAQQQGQRPALCLTCTLPRQEKRPSRTGHPGPATVLFRTPSGTRTHKPFGS